jgi:hypothetical protein
MVNSNTKILIIALPRTGSTSLLAKLSKQHNLKAVFEPFDKNSQYPYDTKLDNIVLKTMMYHLPPSSINVIDGYVELSKSFNTTILLSRRDLKECYESWAYLQQHKDKPIIEGGFNSKKHYFWSPPKEDMLNKSFDFITKLHSELEEISNRLNIAITYYEDIFDKNSNERYRKNRIIDTNKLL